MNREILGLGIAGNFAHHLEQAGESADFVDIHTEEEDAPKGIFPTYVPGSKSFLGVWPFSSDTIRMPKDPAKPIQMEPEVALLCEIDYHDDHSVKSIRPTHFCAYNDCSIRIEGAPKISIKKNWGPESKGIAKTMLPLEQFTKGSMLDHYSLVSFIKRDDTLHQYGEDSPLATYSYFYEKLTDWITDKLNTQKDTGPLEDLSALIREAHYPEHTLISIGATRYTPYGESHYLQKGDTLFVIVYDHRRYTFAEIEEMVRTESLGACDMSVLKQVVKGVKLIDRVDS